MDFAKNATPIMEVKIMKSSIVRDIKLFALRLISICIVLVFGTWYHILRTFRTIFEYLDGVYDYKFDNLLDNWRFCSHKQKG